MQKEMKGPGRLAETAADDELIDVLIAISVVAKRLANILRQQVDEENGGQHEEKTK
jgi:hypothetical protein